MPKVSLQGRDVFTVDTVLDKARQLRVTDGDPMSMCRVISHKGGTFSQLTLFWTALDNCRRWRPYAHRELQGRNVFTVDTVLGSA